MDKRAGADDDQGGRMDRETEGSQMDWQFMAVCQ